MGYQLAHPVYLDVAMMISFLAYLEGGVAMEEEATQKDTGARERLLKGRAGLRARLPWAFVEQQKAQLAAASEAADQVRKAQRSGNPPKRAQAPSGSQDPAEVLAAVVQQAQEQQNEFGVQMMLKMADDIKHVPVDDLLLRTSSGLRAVLTVSSEYYSSEINEYLRAGESRIIGKVTKVITSPDDTVNLTRRTILGVANPAVAQDLVAHAQSEDFKLDVADPIVTAPAVQVLPMAIFI